MILQCSVIQHKKKIKAECDDANHDDLKAAEAEGEEAVLLDLFPVGRRDGLMIDLNLDAPEVEGGDGVGVDIGGPLVLELGLGQFAHGDGPNENKEHKKKIKVECDDANHDDLKAAVCLGFWKDIPEDILLEIFIRLPDYRHVLRSGIVCQSWNSLISQHPQFIPRFISHHNQHQDRYWPLPYTLIFRKYDRFGFEGVTGVQYFQPICKLFSEESVLCARTNFLDFLPSLMVIRGSCNDLLLASPGSFWSRDFYICNPITKQFVQLPEIPRPHICKSHVVGHTLVCMPGPTVRFKVVIFQHPYCLEDLGMEQRIKVFCSESRKWEMACFYYPRAKYTFAVSYLHVVACNGILYWLEHEILPERVISLDLTFDDLSNCHIGVIDFPDGCCIDFRYTKLQIGVVRGRDQEELRLLQVVCNTKERTVDLKIWKLNNKKDHHWILVHDKKKLKRPKKEGEGKQFLFPFLHPTKGDVIFMVWDQKVFQYNLEDTACEMIGELQEPIVTLIKDSNQTINDLLLSFPVVHSNWPTPLPNLAA